MGGYNGKKKNHKIMTRHSIFIKDYELVCTCRAFPEQYDVFKESRIVGYLRLRHNCFSVTVPDVDGEIIYSASPYGDGAFEDLERPYFLNIAIEYIEKFLIGEIKTNDDI